MTIGPMNYMSRDGQFREMQFTNPFSDKVPEAVYRIQNLRI